jgi:hypothetical protein
LGWVSHCILRAKGGKIIVSVESAMKAIFGVIAALVIVGFAAMLLFRLQQLSLPTEYAAGIPGTPAAQPSTSMTPWPDLDDLINDDSRPTRAASLDGSVAFRPKNDFQPAPAHALTMPSNSDDVAPAPVSRPRVGRQANQHTGRARQRQQ